MVDKKKVESYVFYSLMVISLVIFIVTPSHANTEFDYYINEFIDKYLLGNGYYSPSNYPFSSKVVNSFSVVLAIITSIFIGIWRRGDVDAKTLPKHTWLLILVILISGIFTFFLSLNPQEFRESELRRSFGTSQSFHNNPITFLAMMIGKQIWLYMSIRITITYILYKLGKLKK